MTYESLLPIEATILLQAIGNPFPALLNIKEDKHTLLANIKEVLNQAGDLPSNNVDLFLTEEISRAESQRNESELAKLKDVFSYSNPREKQYALLQYMIKTSLKSSIKTYRQLNKYGFKPTGGYLPLLKQAITTIPYVLKYYQVAALLQKINESILEDLKPLYSAILSLDNERKLEIIRSEFNQYFSKIIWVQKIEYLMQSDEIAGVPQKIEECMNKNANETETILLNFLTQHINQYPIHEANLENFSQKLLVELNTVTFSREAINFNPMLRCTIM